MDASSGKMDDFYLGYGLTALLCLCVVASLQRIGKRSVRGEGGTW